MNVEGDGGEKSSSRGAGEVGGTVGFKSTRKSRRLLNVNTIGFRAYAVSLESWEDIVSAFEYAECRFMFVARILRYLLRSLRYLG